MGKGQRAGAREERDRGDCSCFLSLSLRPRQQQHAWTPWETQDSLGKGTGMQAWSAVAPPTPWSPSQDAVRKEPNIPGAPAALPVSLAGRGRSGLRGRPCLRGTDLTLAGVRRQGRGHGPTAEKWHQDTVDVGRGRLARSLTPGLLRGEPTPRCRAGRQRGKQFNLRIYWENLKLTRFQVKKRGCEQEK